MPATTVNGGRLRPPLEESAPTSVHRRPGRRTSLAVAALVAALVLAACGGSEPRQDEDEPEGEFSVEVSRADFPNKQRLAQTSDLILEVTNTGDETIPDLAVTITTDPDADGAFSVISEQEDVAISSRPVWILENGYPYADAEGSPGELSPAGAEAAQTNTFSFGPLEPGASRLMSWRVTPVVAGEYTVSYRVEAGLQGKAQAVTDDGSEPAGEFAVEITDVPPQTRVNDRGDVVEIDEDDIIGQAGSKKQKRELEQDPSVGGE